MPENPHKTIYNYNECKTGNFLSNDEFNADFHTKIKMKLLDGRKYCNGSCRVLLSSQVMVSVS